MLEKKINPEIFRAYDIRGIHERDIDSNVFEKIGNAFRVFSGDKLVVGRDCRISSPELKDGFKKGITRAGVDVIDVGMAPRGVVMFASWKKGLNSAYITASHLPPEWNGIKFVRKDGTSFSENESQRIRDMVIKGDAVDSSWGNVTEERVIDDYEQHVLSRVPRPKKKLRILLDCGNGTAGVVAPDMFRKAGHDVEVLFGEPDGRFPNRESELTKDALEQARKKANGFDLTVAFDGDADRIALIDDQGRIVEPEIVAYVIMQELLKRKGGDVVANIECSKAVDEMASRFGRKVFRTQVGYAFVIKGIYQHNACFGIEKSMHFCIPYIYPFDDGIAAGLYAAFALSESGRKFSEIVDEIPVMITEQINYDCPDEKKPVVIESIKQKLAQEFQNVNTLDGVRVDSDDAWFLIRQSNTSPIIRLNIEAQDKKTFNGLKERLKQMVADEIRGAQEN